VIGTSAPPASTFNTSIDFEVLTCGRNVTPSARTFSRILAAFASSRARSRINAGVIRSKMDCAVIG
jgi:hypothetical protein